MTTITQEQFDTLIGQIKQMGEQAKRVEELLLNPPAMEFLTVAQAAEVLQCSVDVIYNSIRKEEMPGAKKIGGMYRIHMPTLINSEVPRRSRKRRRIKNTGE